MLVHEQKKLFKCEICNAEFELKFRMHIMLVHEGNKPFKCALCDKCFALKCVLKRHIKLVHEQMELFKCKICNGEFRFEAYVLENKHHVSTRKKETIQMCYLQSLLQSKNRNEETYCLSS